MKSKRFVMIMYSLGYLGISIFTQTTVKWYQYFYTPPKVNSSNLRTLIPVGVIGFSMIIARIFDGVSDPLVAYYSDKCKSKRGRRIPFILYGAVPLSLSFIALWFPPVLGESIANFIYLTVVLSLFFIFFTIVTAPYLALISEISSNNSERITLTTMQGITQIIGVMIAEVGSGIIINMYNFKVMGIVLGIIALLSVILTPIFVKENIKDMQEVPDIGMIESVRQTITNKNFAYYLISYITVWFGINTLTITMPYITEVLLKTKAENSGFMIAGAFVLAAVFMPFLPKIVLKYGKKKVMILSSIFLSIIMFLTSFFGSLFSYNVSFVIVVLSGIPLSVIFVVPNAMIADIAQVDAENTGKRREGMFFGAQGLIIKIVIGLSSFITPFLFKTFGYSIDRPLGIRLCGIVAAIFILLGLVFLRMYSIDEAKIENSIGIANR
ncbi:glycoside/pentoside/hexuronide:cation symporter, GPH family [Caloramator quimbayensis]|uniref:Glycoside/pentoside/hexuronide:cation symporter, GPH family n=1 Tax=Caloramator quimbayensis TaxID=1147123 RepID=A0A1T4WJH5_9CLOT|nr:MFS transporter [Caloramator quimbayensis]SKA77506.1 glycoside/pentoside/hexuronide:cation symporter, GPH family [Caloramator quimbayensis]